jgi:hypothetical protein
MSNNLSGIFETVVAAGARAAAAPKFKNAFLDAIYTDWQSGYGKVGNTININIPIVNENAVNNVGNGNIIVSDTNHTSVQLTINQNLQEAFVIKAFDQNRTVEELQSLYMDGWIESIKRKINRSIANLATSSVFSNYTTITSAATNSFQRADIAAAWNNLTSAGAPINVEDMFFVTTPKAWSIMTSDTSSAGNFVQQYVVGEQAAEAARQGHLMPAYMTQLKYDQQAIVTSAGKQTALYFHRYAIGAVPVLAQPLNDPYIQESVIYLGSTPDGKGTWPLTIQMWNDPYNQGKVVNLMAMFALGVPRPEFGSYLISA